MQNFSILGNLINNFLKQQTNKTASNFNVNNHPILDTLQNNQLQQKAIVNQPKPQVTNINTQLELAKMESTERAILVKELLNLPNNLKDLLMTLQNTKNTQQQTLPNNFTSINISSLMQLMQENGKEALSKLMQLTSLINKTGNVDTKQLQELQYIINACMPNANITNTQFMKNLILLYLPWLPIGENNNFEIDFSSNEDNTGGEDSADDTITILIQTENYGNIKILLILESTNKINIAINCAKIFPKDLLLLKLKENSKEYKLETQANINEQETIDRSELDKTRKVHMSGASVLNPYVLLMAHAIIRDVIEIDKNQSLVKIRKEKINSEN